MYYKILNHEVYSIVIYYAIMDIVCVDCVSYAL